MGQFQCAIAQQSKQDGKSVTQKDMKFSAWTMGHDMTTGFHVCNVCAKETETHQQCF